MTTLQILLSVLCALTAVSLVVEIVRDRQPGNLTFGGLVAIEIGLIVQLCWGIAMLVEDHTGVSVAPYLGYLVGALLILPVGFVWSASEKSRSGTAVLLVAVLVLPVLFVRLHDLWSAHV